MSVRRVEAPTHVDAAMVRRELEALKGAAAPADVDEASSAAMHSASSAYESLSGVEKSAANLGVNPDSWKPIAFMNVSACIPTVSPTRLKRARVQIAECALRQPPQEQRPRRGPGEAHRRVPCGCPGVAVNQNNDALRAWREGCSLHRSNTVRADRACRAPAPTSLSATATGVRTAVVSGRVRWMCRCRRCVDTGGFE